MKRFKFAVPVLAAVMLLGGTACTMPSTAPDEVALHYKGGSFTSTKFKECIQSSNRKTNGPGDKHFFYPTSQRNVVATGGEGSDFDPITVVSKDTQEMMVPITINFFLKTDCETLRQFHEQVGNRYKAYHTDGQEWGERYPAGWKEMLRVAIYQPLDTTMDRIAQNYNWRDLYNDPAVKTKIETEVNENIAAIVKRQTNNEEFFHSWSALIQKPTPKNEGLVQAISDQQTNVAKADAAKAEAESRKAAAEAQVAVAKAEAAKEQELIKVLGLEGYLKLKAIEKGMNPYQPTYGQPVTPTGP